MESQEACFWCPVQGTVLTLYVILVLGSPSIVNITFFWGWWLNIEKLGAVGDIFVPTDAVKLLFYAYSNHSSAAVFFVLGWRGCVYTSLCIAHLVTDSVGMTVWTWHFMGMIFGLLYCSPRLFCDRAPFFQKGELFVWWRRFLYWGDPAKLLAWSKCVDYRIGSENHFNAKNPRVGGEPFSLLRAGELKAALLGG